MRASKLQEDDTVPLQCYIVSTPLVAPISLAIIILLVVKIPVHDCDIWRGSQLYAIHRAPIDRVNIIN